MRLASLPMYDADPVAVDAWWHAIAHALHDEGMTDVPDAVVWPNDLDTHWREPGLLLSQTCGYPFVTRLYEIVQVVGAFRYTALGASDIQYRSALVAREGDGGGLADYRGRRVAVNATDSYSGWHSLRAAVGKMSRDQEGGASDAVSSRVDFRRRGCDDAFFAETVLTGSHRASLSAVQAASADLAAVDCITLAGLRRHAPQLLDRLVVIGYTDPAPGLPLITSRDTSTNELAAMRRALDKVSRDPLLATLREALFIDRFVAVSRATWNHIR